MQTAFRALADHIQASLHAGEEFTCSLVGEASDFVRLNRGKVRQPGEVRQQSLSLRLIRGTRSATADTTLSGIPAGDRAQVDGLLSRLRERIPFIPEDPHLLYATEAHSTEREGPNTLISAPDAVDELLGELGPDEDLVGIFGQGTVYRGFAASSGQRNWFSSSSFNLDWAMVHQGDKGAKSGYAGFQWDRAALRARLEATRRDTLVLARPIHPVSPGKYRVYLTPTALGEIVNLLGWASFSGRAVQTRTSTLMELVSGERRLHPSVTLAEDTAHGVAPDFQEDGFVKPDRVPLIQGGAWAGALVSPRTAREYGVPANGASASENPVSLDMAGGDIPTAEVLRRLGTGIYVGNLWYLNYSDRNACRMTGMTRFATFWVEDGEVVAPIPVMRFDETAYNVLGDKLIGLTAERDFRLSADTYFQRSTDSARLPGALVEDFTFTL